MLLLAASLAASFPGGLATLRAVDRQVDITVNYTAELDGWDDWKPAVLTGDCEDYALAKRERLIARGWRADDLQVLFIKMPKNGGHAVLRSVRFNVVLDLDKPGVAVPYREYMRTEKARLICVAQDLTYGHRYAADRC